ncbi:MAG: asparagine synthase-related protein [Desulfovibrionaceae bacterium]
MSERFLPSSTRPWARRDETGWIVWAFGHAFAQGRRLPAAELARRAAGLLAAGEAPAALAAGLNGQWALAAQAPDGTLWLACDHMRSLPLLYQSIPGGQGSDEADRLTSAGTLDPDSVIEFVLAGYATGPHTLYADVRTVQSGEVVRLGAEGAGGTIEAARHHLHCCTYEADAEGPEALAALDQTLMDACARALEVVDGRQIALPLSGGLDSRCLVSCFRRLGYDNLACFAYGLPGNREMVKSRAVAEALGVRWFPVSYDPAELARDLASESQARFRRFSAQACAMACLTEWTAVRRVCEEGLVDRDAVFLSGQSGDFINGSHLKYLLDPEWRADPLDVAGAIRAKHYSLWLDLARRPDLQAVCQRRTAEVMAGWPTATLPEAAAAYEHWENQERQLKYVAQGGRLFEFFGHDWLMPLWDREVMDFFRPVSLGLKLRGYLYAKTLATFDPYGVFAGDMPRARFDRAAAAAEQARLAARPGRRLRRLVSGLPGLGDLLWRRERERVFRHHRRYDPLGFAQAYPEAEYVNRDPGKRHSLALWVRDYLAEAHGVDLARLGR